jgi:hypothetical protein
MKMFDLPECGLAMVNRIFIVALLQKTERWMFLNYGRAPMAQTRRMGKAAQWGVANKCAEVFALPL